MKTQPLRPAASKEPSLADIKAFVANQAATVAPAAVPTGTSEFEVPKEVEQFLAHKETAAQGDKFPLPDIPTEPAADPDSTGQQAILNNALSVSATIPDITQEEKDIFCKATLFDEPVVFDIPVLGGKATVKVRTLSILHTDVVAWWLMYLEQQKKVTTMTLWGIMLNRAHVALRSVSIQHHDGQRMLQDSLVTARRLEDAVAACRTDFCAEPGQDGRYPEPAPEARQAAIDAMDQHVTAMFRTLSPGTFGLMSQAVAVHEQKFNYLTRQAASGNFWLPGATA